MGNNKIPKDIEELYPLSDIQKGMVYHSIMAPDKFIYYTVSVNYVKFKDFDENIFKKAFELMIDKHSILRTGFNMYDFEEPIQIVHKTILPNIMHYDVAGMAEQEQEEYLRKLLANEQQKMFNINNADILWRVRTLNLGDDNICLIWISHHAIMDGWSFASLMTEVNNTYLKIKENPDFIPVKLKNCYKNFVIEQMMEKKKKENIAFWKIELDDYKRINFPGYFQNTNNKDIKNTIVKKFDDELFNKLKNTARKFDTSLKHLCFGAYIYMLNMFSYENDIVAGIVSNCRPHGPDGDKIIGCFLNTIPVRVKIPYLLRWRDYIRLIDHKLLELKKYDRVSFLEIVKNIGEVSYEKNPLFDTVFNFTDFHVYDGLITKNELFNAPHILNNPFPGGGGGGGGHTLFDCTISTTGGFFQIIFNFVEYLISSERVSTLCSSFEKILYKFVEEADQVVKKEDMISDEEKRKILNDFNNTISEYPDNKTITELFEEQVTLSPGNIACIGSSLREKCREIFTDENNSFYYHISYKELNEKSEQLAYVLRQKGILPDTIVGIMVKRSIEMLICIFGILKAGGAYLPIDTEYPPDRIDYMLKDSGTKILVTTNGTEDENTGKWTGEIYDIEKLIHLTYPHNILPSCSLNSLSLAYVIYTSGSTGKPKGVMIKHRAMINFIKGIANIIPFTPNDRILSLTTISFDIFGLETIIPLVCGATVLMAGMEEQVDPVAPGIIIEREHISIFQVTPSRLQMMLSLPEVSMSLKILKFLLVGGEAFPGYILEKVRNFVHGRIFNMYGPTETTIWSTVKELRVGEILSVGKPIANTRIYIIDNAGKLQPWGSVGELCIGGDGIARGYLNRPEMTAERFISFSIPVFNAHAFPGQANLFGENPLKQTTGHEMVYKTGDLARWLPDGNIEFLGRIDHQVKVRGFRIELGEIENRLLKCEGIKDVVVLAREEVGGGKYICAYFVSVGECEISELRKSLLKELPDYMIPPYFIRIEQIPLTSNGKIDRNALPKPELKSGGDYVAARNETEKKLLELWSQILDIKIELISIDSNFFELGGHSLKLMTLVAKISKEFNVHVSFTEIFKMPKIRDLAKYIKEKKTELHLSIEPVEEKEYYELASAQKRLYVLQHMNPGSIAYNMPEIISLPGSSDLVKIEETFKNLIKRHESLRTSFYLLNDRPVQKIHKSVSFEIEKNDKIILSDSPKALFNNFVRPFDLSLAPLLRVGLERNIDGSNILLIDIHHIISDGISNALLITDFQNLSGGELPLLRVQYKDFSEWQNSGREKENLKRQEKYWLQEYEGEMPVLELPTDYPRPVIQSFEGDYLLFEINANDAIALKNMAMSEEATLFMVLFALYNILLARLSNSEDIIAGTPVAGRRHADLEKIIGMFVNTLSMRNYPHGEKTFPDYLQEVKQRTLEAFENQDYQFEELVDKLEIVRDVGRNPLFDVMFNYMVIDSGLESVPDEMKSQESKNDFKNTTSKFDLSLTAIERSGGLFFSFQYGTKLFKEETIERFIIYFKKIVSSVIKNSGLRLCEINILSEEEMNWILNDFNKTGTEYPKDKTIHQLFEEQVEGTPDKIAAVAPFNGVHDESNVHITYRELNEKSDRLAGGLRSKGVGTGTIVGIMVERSIEMVTGMLGILKSGGVYLPLDPEYPRARIDYMLKDSGAKILLTGSEFLNDIDNGPAYPGFLPATNSQLATSPAYIIYTSGSTGKPKGVLVEHRNVVRLVKNSGYIHYAMPDRLLPTGSVAFDISTFEIWSPLLNCSTLFLVPKEFILNAERLKDSLAKYGITILHMIPQLFNQMADQYIEVFAGLRYFLVGGDLVKPGAVNLLRHTYPHLKIIHCYGPTENTTFSTTFMLENDYDLRIPIGKPIGNSCAYIIDKYNHLQPAGVAGELCVGGDGLARGYLNNLELTAEKFTKGYKSYGSYNTDILYKTGDLARWLHDGNIEFLGRIDHQIKIRGFRVELEEIENYILKLNGIKEAVALARERDKGDKYICAYFVSDKEYQVSELRQYVSKELPDYMIPSYFVRMEKLPLTTNGKIDKIALPEPEGISLKADTVYALPANPVEKKLVEIWEKVLGRNNIGINENFFMIGGDSIKSIQIISRMNTAGYKLDMKDLFQFPIISDLAPHVKKLKRIPDQSVITGPIPLVPVQVDFFNKCHEDCHHYNQSIMLYAREGFNKEMLKAVFLKIQEHHDALRITYILNPGNREIVQMGHDLDYPFYLQEYDLKNGGNLENFNAQLNEIQASIDLENGPLMKLGLFHLDDGDRLLITIHHLVIDGVSWRILFEDIENLSGQYQRGEKLILPLKTDSFKLWSEKLLEYANSKNFLKEKAYWQKIESVEKKPIPKDFDVDDNYTIDMVNVSFTLSAEETDHLLTKVNEIYRTKINDILLTALGMAIKKTFGHDRIFIAMEGHGREQILEDIDISRTVGWFTSVYPALMDFSYSGDMGRQIKEIKETLLGIPNKGTGYGLLKYITEQTNKKHMTFKLEPQISFNYLGQFDADIKQLSSFQIAKESPGNSQGINSKGEYLLNVSGIIANNRLTMTILYNKRHFKTGTLAELMGNLESELKHIIMFCSSINKIEFTPGDFTYKDLSIETVDRLMREYPAMENVYTLTPMQEGMLFHALVDDSSYSYFEQMSYRLEGELNIGIVERSINELFKRHDILRTIFVYKDLNRPVQIVLKERAVDFYYEDIRSIKEKKEKEVFITNFKQKDKAHSFDLSNDVLMRVAILRVNEFEYEFIWSLHHILMDGWCVGILNNEFFEIYSCYIENKPCRLAEVKPYRTYIDWLEKQDIEESAQYWENYLDSFEEQTGIPKTKKEENGYKNESVFAILDREKTGALNKLAGKSHVTLNIVMQTLWGILLGKYSGKEDVVFGTVVSGRPSELDGVETMVGLFINTIPVRIVFEEKMNFYQLLQVVQEEALAGKSYHFYPLAEIQAKTALKQNLIDHLFIFENYPISEQIKGHENKKNENNKSLKLANVEIFEQTNYGFNVELGGSDQLRISFKYNGNVYDADWVERISGHFCLAIDQVIENPELKIGSLTLLADEEKNRLLYEFNDIEVAYPKDKMIHQLLEAQVEQSPDNIAVVAPSAAISHELPLYITYQELNEKSDRLAQALKRKGVDTDIVVGIMARRSLEMIIGIISIFKAGGAYIPIDVDYPGERIDFIFKDSGSAILLTENELLNFSSSFPVSSMAVVKNSSPAIPNRRPATSLAYVIYTSGSTGKPKGAMVDHIGMINHIYAKINDLQISRNSVVAQNSSHTFDISVWQFLAALTQGGKTVIYPDPLVLNPDRLISRLIRDQITILEVVPSYLTVILTSLTENNCTFSHLEYLLVTGEEVKLHLVKQWFEMYPGIKMVNAYGPTEASDDITHHIMDKVPGMDRIPVGKPVQNMNIYIVDRHRQLCPIGVKGEIWVSGIGVGRGYLNDVFKTAQVFISDPFTNEEGVKLYKTGDLGRWLANGTIEFFGRTDYQVKIHGFRIELGEIDNRLLNFPGIKEAVVLNRTEENDDTYLCAYIVSDNEYEISELREYLAQELPDYMIPSYFVYMKKIPLTPNGKIDRKALPKPEVKVNKRYIAPQNEIETKLVALWSEILGRDELHISQLKTSIGIDDNFFELGGHSLKATILTAKIHKVFDVKVPLKEIFIMPKIKDLANYIKEKSKEYYFSIEPSEKKEYYFLSSAQKRLYILQQMMLDSITYNMPEAISLPVEFDAKKIEATFRKLLERHESLRTSYQIINDLPVQVVHDKIDFCLDLHDLKDSHNLQNYIKQIIRPFDLAKPQSIRASLIKKADKSYILIVDMHHIVSDGVSHDILVKDFLSLYRGEDLQPLRIQYKDFSEWQNGEKEKEKLKRQEEYWLKEFAGEIPILELPNDYLRPVEQSFEGKSVNFFINEENAAALKAVVRSESSTLFMVLLGIYTILLSKLSGQEDIVIGTAVAGRRHADLEKIIGMFVNTLSLRNYPGGERTFRNFLGELKERTLMSFENQEYPFEELVDNLSLKRDIGRNPLFDTMFVLQNMNTGIENGPSSQADSSPRYENIFKTTKFDLTLSGMERDRGLFLSFEYCIKLFKTGTIERFIAYFKKIVAIAVSEPGIRIREIDILSEEEKNRILFDFNNTQTGYPEHKTIHQLVAEQVLRRPDNIAVFGPSLMTVHPVHLVHSLLLQITYKELNDRAHSLAYRLHANGAGPDTIIGIKVARSAEMVIGMLGILKSGGAYLPIDTDYPGERIDYILKDSGAKLMVTHTTLEEIPNFNAQLPALCPSNSSSLAYVIYTSGTTGKPKGVLVEHRNVANVISWFSQKAGLGYRTYFLQLSDYTVDPSVDQIFGSLISGASVFIVEKELRMDILRLRNYILLHQVNVVNYVPAYLKELFLADGNKLDCVHTVISAGDNLYNTSKDAIMSYGYRLVNVYGPTETTIDALARDCSPDSPVSLGKPIANIRVYVVDKYGKALSIGIVGELYIGGAGVTRGYLNRPELNKEKFVRISNIDINNKFYRSGDIVRWLEGGNIEMIGRMDHQVKIRGYRIELGEIENRLLKTMGIKDAAVAVQEKDGGDKYICAYFVSDKKYTVPELRDSLAKELPAYMIPAHFIQLENIPLTPNGKIDRKALPGPELKTGNSYKVPGNEIENKLITLWAEVLGVSDIGIDDNFFELGGHSLKATILVPMIHKAFNVKVPLVEIFKKPNIKELAQYINGKSKENYISIVPIEKKEYYDTSYGQKRVWMLSQSQEASLAFNMSATYFLNEATNIDFLEAALESLIARHESLRTVFLWINEDIKQKILLPAEINFQIDYKDIKDIDEKEKIVRDLLESENNTPFDLQRGPLLRAKLVQMETHKYLFVFSMHHIISDFISMEVLKKELFQLYDFFNPGKMNSLEPLKIQYKDFVYWQKKQLDGQELDRLREFWLNRLGGSLPVLQLPLDKVRPKIQTNNGEKIVFSIPEGLTGKLRTIAKENDATLFMILMTTVNLLLFFYSGQDDMIIGVPVSGREHLDVENQIGFYLNTLALRIKFSGENIYLKLLEIVKKVALEAYEHQMYPFDKLIDDLKIKREPGRHPLFDVMADMINLNQGVPFDDLSQEQVETDDNEESIAVHRGRSKFDLTFYFFEEIKRITIIFEYSTDLFERKTIQLMAKRYKKILKKIIANPLASLTTIIEDDKIAIPAFGSFPAG